MFIFYSQIEKLHYKIPLGKKLWQISLQGFDVISAALYGCFATKDRIQSKHI